MLINVKGSILYDIACILEANNSQNGDMMSSFPENNEYKTFGKQNKDEMSKYSNLPSSSFKIFTNKRVKQTLYCREK